jgi:hypothetical protein
VIVDDGWRPISRTGGMAGTANPSVPVRALYNWAAIRAQCTRENPDTKNRSRVVAATTRARISHNPRRVLAETLISSARHAPPHFIEEVADHYHMIVHCSRFDALRWHYRDELPAVWSKIVVHCKANMGELGSGP